MISSLMLNRRKTKKKIKGIRLRFRNKDWNISIFISIYLYIYIYISVSIYIYIDINIQILNSSQKFTITCQHILATAVRDLIMAFACDSSSQFLPENVGTPHNPTNTPVRKPLLMILMTRRLSEGGWTQKGLWGCKAETYGKKGNGVTHFNHSSPLVSLSDPHKVPRGTNFNVINYYQQMIFPTHFTIVFK